MDTRADSYQYMWESIGQDISSLVKDFFSTGFSLHKINKTSIVLIPKKNNPQNANDFRLISLCNVIYNIISEVLANRIRELLEKNISPFQSAFVKGRIITNNYIVAHEVLHYFKKKRENKGLGLKLDMAKAYNRMEWNFV